MAFKTDNGGFRFECTDAKMSISSSTWATPSRGRLFLQRLINVLFDVMEYLPKALLDSQAELKAWNEAQGNIAVMSANRRRMTNIDTFRAYALAYPKSHPEIQPNMTCMVCQMQTTAQGIPLKINCFTRTTAWADYERIQGDIFDYLLAVLPEFGLSLYQQPSGTDLRAGLLPAVLGASHIPEAEKRMM